MLTKVRVLGRIIGLLIVTLAYYAAYEVGLLWHRGRRERIFDLRTRIYQGWAHAAATVFGMRVRVVGEPPQPPYFFVMNHLSYIDVLIAAMFLPGARFIARHDMADWPLLGHIAQRLDTIFVNRKSISAVADVCRTLDEAFGAGYGVGMAPEATTGKGDCVLPFHPPLLEPAVRSSVPVCYATIRYRMPGGENPAYVLVNWWEDISFAAHALRLLHAPSFEAEVIFGSTPVTARDRKQLARDLHAAISDVFVPMVTADGQPLDHLTMQSA